MSVTTPVYHRIVGSYSLLAWLDELVIEAIPRAQDQGSG